MTDYSYVNSGYDYAPVATVTIRLIDQTDNIEVKMLIDSGSNASLIPKKIIEQIKENGIKMPYGMADVQGYDEQSPLVHKTYQFQLVEQESNFGKGEKVTLVEFDSNEGILGRDVLNNYHLKLPGSL